MAVPQREALHAAVAVGPSARQAVQLTRLAQPASGLRTREEDLISLVRNDVCNRLLKDDEAVGDLL